MFYHSLYGFRLLREFDREIPVQFYEDLLLLGRPALENRIFNGDQAMGGIFHEFLSFFREKNAGVPPSSGFQVQITGLFHPAYRRVDRGFCGAGLFVKNTLIAAGAVFIEGVENIKLAVRETEL